MEGDDDEARRQQAEISMFAKLASGDTFQGVQPGDIEGEEQQEEKKLIAAASSVEDSGTFAMATSPNAHIAVASFNLDAAAAALTVVEKDSCQQQQTTPPPEEVNLRSEPCRPPPEPMPMYNERVMLPRPLFYGPVLPPRVIKEAREAVLETMKELNLDLNKRPRLSQLPPHVRNVVGAIESFGFGIPIFPSDIKDEDSYKGSEYVSTYQPVWGDVARAVRAELRKQNGEEAEEPTVASAGEATQDGETPVALAGEFSPGEAADCLTPQNSNKARGGDEPNIAGSSSFPGSASPSNNVAKSLLLRSKSAPVINKGAPPAMSEKDQFLQWARGKKPTTPPRIPRTKSKSSPTQKKDSPTQKKDEAQDDVEVFSRWARGKSTSTPPSTVKRSTTAPADDKKLFSIWAQGDAGESPTVRANRKIEGIGKIETFDGTVTDVSLFWKWSRGQVNDSPNVSGKLSPDPDDPDETARESLVKPAPEKPASFSIPDKNAFSQRAQGNSPSSTPPPLQHKSDKDSDVIKNGQVEKGTFAQWARGESTGDGTGSLKASNDVADLHSSDHSEKNSKVTDTTAPMSDQDVFSHWARGDLGTNNSGLNTSIRSISSAKPDDTFCAAPSSVDDDYSDDDSVDRSEMKKIVGMNEHLNAALASLALPGERAMPSGTESISADEANLLLSQMGATTKGGRPLSNLEITNGSVPLFGCDDAPLPSEADLGLFQTKEEQMRDLEQRHSQEIIDEHTYPNIFGPVGCPNPAQGPDDNHSWYSRTIVARRQVPPPGATGHQVSGPGTVPVLQSPSMEKIKMRKHHAGRQSPLTVDGESGESVQTDIDDTRSTRSVSSRSRKGGPRTGRKRPPVPPSNQSRSMSFDANARFGWWNVPEENDKSASVPNDSASLPDSTSLLQLPPNDYGSPANPIITRLTPSPEKLREENLPLSNLHAATAVTEALPFLSDRPPSFRYLQIDTETVGFTSLSGEIEPLFCSLAIYHVETTAPNRLDPRAAPVPNIQRCGRVTEVFNFDVVRDPEVEARCTHALWPYASSSEEKVPSTAPSASREASQGSRCGVFPLASNLNFANLYAIIIVHKVLSDREGVEPYITLSTSDVKGTASRSDPEIGELRDKAEKVSSRHGHFLMPFAFGVAPLLQIFGTDIPTVVTSRAVQIPLFRFLTGQGDRPIIDHIMVMLYPRADHEGITGPAPLTNGGTAMLVMRNFGYLGLHSAVFSKGSLARDRLVDFSGELQVRRDESREDDDKDIDSPCVTDDRAYVVSPWHKQFISEPTVNGGRNPVDVSKASLDVDLPTDSSSGEVASRVVKHPRDKSRSKFYAQELAPVPLRLMPPTSKPLTNVRKQRGGRLVQADVEPVFHSTFCNELLCHPRLLFNAPKGNIAIKVEVREMEWSALQQAYLARIPKFGPSLHNSRRGPFLVQEAFTACSVQAVPAHFLDEFKMKLPLILTRRSVGGDVDSGPLALFFSVYNIDIKSRRRWGNRAEHKRFSLKDSLSNTPRKGPRGQSSFGLESSDTETERKKNRIDVLACGFLPITTSDTSCLVDDGLHDVKLMYTAELFSEDDGGHGTLILNKIAEQRSRDGTFSFRTEPPSRSEGDGGDDDSLSNKSEKLGMTADGSFIGTGSVISETATESDMPRSETSSGGGRSRSRTKRERMTLQVRIVAHSSVHQQNATLNEFLRRLPDAPAPLVLSSVTTPSLWRLPRSELLKHFTTVDIGTDTHSLSDQSQKLLLYTIDVSKSSLCPAAESSAHFIRIFTQLMRTMVSGSGTPSLLWANPACAIPLRIHAFATLLQVISSVNTYMVRSGATQINGKGKWNLTLLGKVVAMIFDEEQLFTRSGDGTGEVFVLKDWMSMKDIPTVKTTPDSDKKPQHHRRMDQMRSRQSSQQADVMKNTGNGNPAAIESLDDFRAVFASMSDSVVDNEQPTSLFVTSGEDLVLPQVPKSSLDERLEQNGPSAVEGQVDKTFDFKIDSKSDFQSNLWAGSAESLLVSSSVSGSAAAQNMIHAFGAIGPSSRRKWVTAPASGLATIHENVDPVYPDLSEASSLSSLRAVVTQISPGRAGDETNASDAVDSELVRTAPATNKKMRVPQVKRSVETAEDQRSVDDHSFTSLTVPSTDEEIERSGTAFLDAIGKNLGYGVGLTKNMGGEEQRVGHAHHRKTLSRCSIDWTIAEVDVLMGNQEPMEQALPQMTGEDQAAPTSVDTPNGVGAFSGDDSLSMSSLAEENKNTVRLPNYLDRLVTLGKGGGVGRWCPYAYEVIILQWVILLVAQRRSGENTDSTSEAQPSNLSDSINTEYPTGSFSDIQQGLTDAALRARGVAIACAPVLLEIIKKSIGWRVDYMRGQAKMVDNAHARKCPPLVRLDEFLLAHLEQLISIVTDACIDSRNFDSWEFRQTSIDVNDSIIRFLRDMFAFVHTEQVHRLMLVYLSRFVVKEGKHSQDRDSKIGLRCSWEISKLRLNAITALVRFPDFIRVNSPQLQTWSNWALRSPSHSALDFYSMALEQLESLTMSGFTTTEKLDQNSSFHIPPLKPHWLAELVTDICLAGTEHAEQNIQHRAASLLHELFWAHSQEAKANGTSAMVATMYVPFLTKVLGYTSYLASLTAKHQLRKDIMPCAVFVMQCAPDGIMRALWRKLLIKAEGKGHSRKYGGVVEIDGAGFRREVFGSDPNFQTSSGGEERVDPDIYDVFGLLNLALSTFEYEGCDSDLESENILDRTDQLAMWKKDFLLAIERDERKTSIRGQGRPSFGHRHEESDISPKTYGTSSSRKWHAHDASIVIIHSSRLIVREMIGMQGSIKGDVEYQTDEHTRKSSIGGRPRHVLDFSRYDMVVFVRAVTSVYLHALSLRQSDIAVVKTLNASIEIVKIYGIKVFLLAVGETLQHWMRLVSFHCGARRAEVRVQALEFLWLVLRLTWDGYGSFFRIRVPLLSVLTEVMERIVATATTRNYREQRRMGVAMQSLPNDCAEASLSPLWRTLDRLHHQSASQNLAFRSALTRLARSMKKLYRAYIAAHALAIVNRARSPLSPASSMFEGDQDEASVYLQSRRIITHRIITASAGYSKQFLGLQRSSSQQATVAHNEAVEDAFLDAAYVFSPTELPSNRCAWLRKLAEFHQDRRKFAEEATCRFHIHLTLRQAARLHPWLWSNMPFVAWTVNATDSIHLEGEGPAGEPNDFFDVDYDLEDLTVEDPGIFEHSSGKQIDKKNSFRRIFYRVANSLRMNTGDPEIGGKRNLFCGVTFAWEYMPTTPSFSLRDMEEELVEEAELAGDKFLEAGIPESSRFAWSLATQIYAEKVNYGKLAHAYRRLATVVSSKVPVIDTNSHTLELSHPLGRFYRVWFHGGAPDEMNGTEFVYRAAGSVKLEQFGKHLTDVINGLLPENTPIDLVLDDGRPETHGFRPSSQRRPLGPLPIEPVKIKVTPLRPLLKQADRIRGTPEWFFSYADIAFARPSSPSLPSGLPFGSRKMEHLFNRDETMRACTPTHHHDRSSSASVFASGGSVSSTGAARVTELGLPPAGLRLGGEYRESAYSGERRGQLVGVDKFSFLQPARKDRTRSARDWLKSAGDIADKSLRVTQLQVEQPFPACVARQTVMHRVVFQQSPLEAGIEAVCSWCSVLFRTAVASNGIAVLGAQAEHGIGNNAAKVLIDSMLSSRVREMGLVLLRRDAHVAEQIDGGYGMMADFDRLSDDEVNKLQLKLARVILVFMEILHLLISRNRDLLLEVMEARKRGEHLSTMSGLHRHHHSAGPPTSDNLSRQRGHARRPSSGSGVTGHISSAETDFSHRRGDDGSAAAGQSISAYANEQTDKAIAVQSELQRSFIKLARELSGTLPLVLEDETPRWLKEVVRENYFTAATYKHAKIRMEDEICFYDNFTECASGDGDDYMPPPSEVMSIDNNNNSIHYDRDNPSESGSQSGRSSGPITKQQRGMSTGIKTYGTQLSGISQDTSSSIFHV